MRNGEAFREAFGDRVGFRYSESEDRGLFWSNDARLTIGQMARSLGLLETAGRAAVRAPATRRIASAAARHDNPSILRGAAAQEPNPPPSSGALALILSLTVVPARAQGPDPLPGGEISIAAKYPGDAGIDRIRAVLFAHDFEADSRVIDLRASGMSCFATTRSPSRTCPRTCIGDERP